MRTHEIIFDTLFEAFEEANLKVEGFDSGKKVSIYKNKDETFEISDVESIQQSAINDGTFEEIGYVNGWNADVFDFDDVEITREEKAQEVFSEYKDELFNEFCESFNIEY